MRGFLEKISPKDIQFVFNAIIISLVVMALLFTFKPYMGNDPLLAEIKQMDKSIITVSPRDLDRIVQSSTGKPVMLFMYASWCGYCKQVMPMLVQMVHNHELDQIEPVFLSVDEQPRSLSKYLVYKGYSNAFTPYRLDRDFSFRGMSSFVMESGSHYQGSIPYIGFFNREGKLISDASGVVEEQDVLGVVKRIQNGYKPI